MFLFTNLPFLSSAFFGIYRIYLPASILEGPGPRMDFRILDILPSACMHHTPYTSLILFAFVFLIYKNLILNKEWERNLITKPKKFRCLRV